MVDLLRMQVVQPNQRAQAHISNLPFTQSFLYFVNLCLKAESLLGWPPLSPQLNPLHKNPSVSFHNQMLLNPWSLNKPINHCCSNNSQSTLQYCYGLSPVNTLSFDNTKLHAFSTSISWLIESSSRSFSLGLKLITLMARMVPVSTCAACKENLNLKVEKIMIVTVTC